MTEKIKLGISSCLLGEKVRYDGGHKLDHYLKYTLGQFVDWVPVCPEVECGLSTPREAMRLVGNPGDPHLITIKTHIDYTALMQKWINKKLNELIGEDLCGFIFKSKSPSSGMQGIKVYQSSTVPPVKRGIGLFAKAFMEKFPTIPVEDDGRLQDPRLRENFIERVFVFYRWKKFLLEDSSIHGLVVFHANHKLLIMSHSTEILRKLGKMAAQPEGMRKTELFDTYFKELMTGLKLKTTVKKHINVLHHIVGYFKKDLTSWEKEEVLGIIENYRKELIPLIVPIILLQHFVLKYNKTYLKLQYYLNPHPVELMLRNYI